MADAFTKPITNNRQSEHPTADAQQQWGQAIHGMSAQQPPLTFEPEYNPALIEESDFPLFDLAGLER